MVCPSPGICKSLFEHVFRPGQASCLRLLAADHQRGSPGGRLSSPKLSDPAEPAASGPVLGISGGGLTSQHTGAPSTYLLSEEEDLVAKSGKATLREAFLGLEREVPDRVARVIRNLRHPDARWVRIPVGVLFLLGGPPWTHSAASRRLDAPDWFAADGLRSAVPAQAGGPVHDLDHAEVGGAQAAAH